MRIKPPVLDGNDRGGNILGQLVQGDRFPAHLAAVGNQLAVGGNNADIGRTLWNRPAIRGRKLNGVIGDNAGNRYCRPDGKDQAPIKHFADDAPECQGPFCPPAPAGWRFFVGFPASAAAAATAAGFFAATPVFASFGRRAATAFGR